MLPWPLGAPLLRAQDSAQLFLKALDEPLAAQRTARAFMTAHQDGFLLFNVQRKVASPIADLAKHGLNLDQDVVLALEVGAGTAPGIVRGLFGQPRVERQLEVPVNDN